jgi:hypothetical protein
MSDEYRRPMEGQFPASAEAVSPLLSSAGENLISTLSVEIDLI